MSALESVVIENGIELIPEGAFAWCFNLEKISIPESVKVIEKEAFLCCRSIDEIGVSASNSVYYNPGNCLVETATKTLILASRNMNISDGQVNAFGESSVFCGKLETLYVPASVISIHENAFKYFDVDHIIVDHENPVYHSAGDCLIETATGKLIRGSNNSVIPHDGSVTSIAHSAFETCLELESIIIPSSVKSIGYGAFTICDKLKNVEISEGVVSIGNGAFGRCIALESINIPESVTVMEDHIFYECSESLNINCHAEAKPEGWSEMWLGCYALVSWNGKPEVSEPETSESEVSEPEVSEPEVSEPEVSEPETSEQVFVPHPIQYAAYNFMPTLTAEARKEMRGAEEGAINTGRLFVIHSKHGLEELAKNCVFSEYDQFKDDFQRFVEATDDAYFDEYSLLIQYVWSPNLMTRYKIRRVWLEEDLVTLLYDAIPHDGASPQLVQDNFLVAEVKKAEIADYTTFSSDPNIITAPKKEIDNSQRDVDFSVVKLHESMEIFDNAYYYENTNYWMKQQLFTVTSFEELETLQSFCHDSSSSYGFGDFIKDIPEDFFDKKAFIFVYATSSSGGDVLYIDSIKTNKGKLEVNMNICHCGATEDIYQRLFAVDVDRNVIDTCNEFVLNENIIQYDDLPDLYKPLG